MQLLATACSCLLQLSNPSCILPQRGLSPLPAPRWRWPSPARVWPGLQQGRGVGGRGRTMHLGMCGGGTGHEWRRTPPLQLPTLAAQWAHSLARQQGQAFGRQEAGQRRGSPSASSLVWPGSGGRPPRALVCPSSGLKGRGGLAWLQRGAPEATNVAGNAERHGCCCTNAAGAVPSSQAGA